MLTAIVIVVGLMFYFFGFIMSFDAPGSDKDPAAWGMRALMFSPFIVFAICFFMGLLALRGGNYTKAAIFGGVAPVLAAGFVLWMFIYSFASIRDYKKEEKQRKENAEKYPLETYTRTSQLGTDTILVWPDGIVAYRLHVEGLANTWNGPLGDLDKDRKFITYKRNPDTRISIEEIEQFLDDKGVKVTDRYTVQ